MLALAFGLLCAAVVIGAGLAILFVKRPVATPPPGTIPRTIARAIPVAHAALGAASLVALTLALRRGQPATGMGTAGFGPIALGLLALTLALGLVLALTAWRRHRPAAMLVGAHASLAVAAFVVLLTLVALG
ncbi:MAG TPA: hypothetical protein VND95_15325 [Stellaceae bacterium]|nr:hypothetical protein [Stellaceae bacterium]